MSLAGEMSRMKNCFQGPCFLWVSGLAREGSLVTNGGGELKLSSEWLRTAPTLLWHLLSVEVGQVDEVHIS